MVSVQRAVEIEQQVKELMAQALQDVDTAAMVRPYGPGDGASGAAAMFRPGGPGDGASGAATPTARRPLGSDHLGQVVSGRKERSALDPINIRDLIVPGAGNRRIFRVLLTNACRYSCDYCPMRAQRDLPRHALPPEALAKIFLKAFRMGWCDGLFVTSGIPKSPVYAMEKLLEFVDILRVRLGYRGYLHVKALAGAEPGQVERLVRLVDRISYNLESACQQTLDEHAPEKSVAEGVKSLETARRAAIEHRASQPPAGSRPQAAGFLSAGATTQFVVGLGKESDRQLLQLTENLEKRRLIHHAQFSAFRPIRGTPLESRPEAPELRERRLYQADHLLREYGFGADELVYDPEGKLPLDLDPKLRWAMANPDRFPVDLLKAGREELQRVPGLGPTTIERLLRHRAMGGTLRGLEDLRRLGAIPSRVLGFVTLGGRRLGERWVQGTLFEAQSQARGATYEFSPGTFR